MLDLLKLTLALYFSGEFFGLSLFSQKLLSDIILSYILGYKKPDHATGKEVTK